MQRIPVGRVHVYVTCLCGEEIDFEDASVDSSSESQPCENCGRKVEIQISAEAYAFDPEDGKEPEPTLGHTPDTGVYHDLD